MVDLLKESHIPLFSSKKMEQEKKKSELLSNIDKYRLVKDDDHVFLHSYEYGRSSEYVSNIGTEC